MTHPPPGQTSFLSHTGPAVSSRRGGFFEELFMKVMSFAIENLLERAHHSSSIFW